MAELSDLKLAAIVAIATAFGAVAVPVVANWLPSADTKRETETKLVEIAVSVLAAKRADGQAKFPPDEQALRQWAVEIINRAAFPQIEGSARTALIEGTATLPLSTLDQVRMRSPDGTTLQPWEYNPLKGPIPRELIERWQRELETGRKPETPPQQQP